MGTMKQKSGGGGLGKLLGSVLGGAVGLLTAGPGGLVAGGLKGASLGGTAGGFLGANASPGGQKNMGMGTPTDQAIQGVAPQTSAIDRLNKMMDIGQTLGSIELPKSGASVGNSALNRRFDYMSGRRMA